LNDKLKTTKTLTKKPSEKNNKSKVKILNRKTSYTQIRIEGLNRKKIKTLTKEKMTKIKKIKTKRMDSEIPTKIRNKFSCLGVGERNEGGERSPMINWLFLGNTRHL
jgi:hypothetical protein